MTSGTVDGSFYQLPRVQSIGMGFQIPRTTVPVMGRFKPLDQRPVVNFTAIPISIDFIKGDKSFETNLGLVNPTGVGYILGQADPLSISSYGARNFQVKMAPNNSNNYAGQINISSGVMTSFSLGGSVGDPVKGSVSFECLHWDQVENTGVRNIPAYGANLIKSENMTLTGIDFSGLGITNLVVQSFRLDVSMGRTATIRLGEKYPERRITEMNATLAIQGFLEGINTAITGLSKYDCGNPTDTDISISLSPSCSAEAATVITMKKPYLESQQFGAQVGNYTSVDINFACPISTNLYETMAGSNLIIM